MSPPLETSRLRLIVATPEIVEREIEGPDRLAQHLQVALPGDWPPEHHSADSLAFTRTALGAPDAAGWWLHYIVLTGAPGPILAGIAGYKGPPQNGTVEIGYSVIPSHQRRGIATEACALLIDRANDRGADTVIAHTLPHLEPSIGVLKKLGFEEATPPEPGVLAFRRPKN